MKLQDALKRIFWQFGVVVLQEKRLMALLSDFKAFDEYPAMRQVMKAVSDDGYAKELCRLILNDDRENFSRYAADVKKLLVSERQFLKELSDYALDSISFGLGVSFGVDEPSYNGFDPLDRNNICTDGNAKTGHKDADMMHRESFAKTAGNPSAFDMYELGEKYYYGIGGEQNYPEAVKCFRNAAEQGNAAAQFRLAFMYARGLGVEYNDDELMKWLHRSAGQDNAEALYWLGLLYGAEHLAETFKLYRRSAEHGNVSAMCGIAWMYEEGMGVSQNYEKAVIWYRKAADEPRLITVAERGLGRLYEEGHGVPQDFSEAVKWYLLAVDDDYDAQYRLGRMYEEGRGVAQNYGEAVKLYRKAAEYMDSARYRLAKMYENGLGVAQDYDEALKWYWKLTTPYSSYCKDAKEAIKRLQELSKKLG